MNIWFCGMSGVGKSTLLQQLETRFTPLNPGLFHFSIDCIDLDREIEKNLTARGILHSLSLGDFLRVSLENVQVFRQIESDLISQILQRKQKEKEICMIALGGGALTAEHFKIIKSHSHQLLCYLKDDFEKIWIRLSAHPEKLLANKSREEVYQIYLKRSEIFEKSDLIIEFEQLKGIEEIDALGHNLIEKLIQDLK